MAAIRCAVKKGRAQGRLEVRGLEATRGGLAALRGVRATVRSSRRVRSRRYFGAAGYSAYESMGATSASTVDDRGHGTQRGDLRRNDYRPVQG